MDKTVRLAVVVTTYNWPEALERVLQGLAKQTVLPDEIWVADDGSAPATEGAVKQMAHRVGLTVHHVWQEDKGFRAAAIRNRAVYHSRSDYIVFLDGDCVPSPDFVEMHKALAAPGYCVVGNRVLLSREATPQWISQSFAWPGNAWGWLKARFTGAINRCAPLMRLPVRGWASAWRTHGRQHWEGAKTCNLGLWKQDLISVNGLDESYAGWGLEDSDLMIRILRNGVRRKNGRFATGVVHLWHKENDRSALPENQQRLEAILADSRIQAQTGLDKIDAQDHHVTVFLSAGDDH